MKEVLLRPEDIHNGNLILINKNHPIRINEKHIIENLEPIDDNHSEHLVNKRVANILKRILNDIGSEGRIVPVSGFRSKKEQSDLYDSSITENGIEFTQKFVAKPDESEHQSGLAIDLGENKSEIDFICPDFPYYGIFNEFREAAIQDGFIERYKESKENITGISKEPWHFRFIGFPHSAIIEEKELALEEYHEFIKNYDTLEKAFKYKNYRIFYVKLMEDEKYIYLEDDIEFDVSGNNIDGFIFTLYNK
jgi:D-alanyl-D-alanine dipeptidase/carboxypeptidase